MTEQPPEPEGARERLLATTFNASKVIAASARATNQHEDRMLIWLVGLSGGAVYGGVQLLRWLAEDTPAFLSLLAVLPWIGSGFSGVMARYRMRGLLQEENELYAKKMVRLMLLERQGYLPTEEFKETLVSAFIQKDESKRAAELSAKANCWTRRCEILFALGIVWFLLIQLGVQTWQLAR